MFQKWLEMKTNINISRCAVGTCILCVLPALAQPEFRPANGPSYRLVSPEEAAKLTLTEKPMALHLRDVTLADALAELSKQSGVSLETSFGADPVTLAKKLSLDLETRSFNEAFSAILDEADVKAKLQRFGSGPSWNVLFNQTEQQNDPPPQSGVGPFQVRVLNVNSNLSKSASPTQSKAVQRSQTNRASINFGFASDPQLVTSEAPRVRITRATDEKGRSLREEDPVRFPTLAVPGRANIRFEGGGLYSIFGVGGNSMEQTSVPLGTLPEDSEKLALLEGVATYVLPSKREKWEVTDVLNAKGASHEFQSGGQQLTLSLKDVQKAGGGVVLDLRVAFPDGNEGGKAPLSSGQLTSGLRLVDAGGQKLMASSISSSVEGNELSVQATYSLARGPRTPFVVRDGKMVPAPLPEAPALAEPLRLFFDIPTEFVQTEVPFSFSDLPLP